MVQTYLYCFDWVQRGSSQYHLQVAEKGHLQWSWDSGTDAVELLSWQLSPWIMMPLTSGKSQLGPTMDPLWTATDPLWTATDHCKSTAWKLFRHDIRPVASLQYSDPSDVKIKLRPDMRPDLQYDQPIFQWFFPFLFFLEWQCAFDIPIVSQDHLHTLHCNHYIMVFCVCICWCFLSTKVRMFFMPSVDGIHLKTSQNQTIKPSRSE